MLKTIKKTVIPTNINVSFQSTFSPTPFNKIPLMIIINHLAGIMLLMICMGKGILEIGKIKPESMITGNINPNNEIIIAVCCEFEIVEMRIPNESAVIIKRTLSNASKNKLPSIGILNTKKPNATITTALMIDRKI